MMNNLEKRLENTERALVSLWNLIADTNINLEYCGAEAMMIEYFNSQEKLGAKFSPKKGVPFFHEGRINIQKG